MNFGSMLEVKPSAVIYSHWGKLPPAVHAKNLNLDKDISAEQALKKIVENCLGQFLPNMAAIADGVAEAEHIHQARVAYAVYVVH